MVAPTITIAALIGIVVVPYVVFRLYGRWVVGLDEPTAERVHRLRRASTIGLLGIAVVITLLVIVLDVVAFLEGVLEAITPGLVDRVPVEFAVFLAAVFGPFVLASVAVILGVLPHEKALRDTEVEASTAVWKTVLGLCATVVPIVAWLVLVETLPSAWFEHEVVMVAVFGVFLLAVYAVTPYLAIVFGDTHRLTGAKRDVVDSFCRELGFDPRDVRVIETEGVAVANAAVAGTLPGVTVVFLTDHLLEEFSRAELEAIVAHEVGHVVGRHLWIRGGVTVIAFGLWIVAVAAADLGVIGDRFGFVGLFALFMAVFLGYYLLVYGTLAVRQEYAADRYASEQTSVETTVDALESMAAMNHTKREVGRLYSLLTVHPSIDDRVNRLRASG